MDTLRKKVLAFSMVGVLSLLPGIEGKADFSSCGNDCINTQEVFVYDRDSFDGEIIGTLKVNSYLYRILKGENCSLVNYQEHLGFVENDSIKSISENRDYHTYQEVNEIGITTSRLNLRVGASEQDTVIGVLDQGVDFRILGIVDNGWYLVDYQNTLGFVSGEFVKILTVTDIQSEMSSLPDIMKAVVLKDEVHVREKPTSESKSLGVYKKGLSLHMLQKLDNGWYEVENNGYIGYVKGDYVKERYIINGEAYAMVYMKNDALAYRAPFGEVIGNLDQYESCYVYGETSTHYLIESEGRVGFVKKSDCEKLENTFVIVDISSQKMILYNGVNQVLISDVVTGKDSTPTDLGIYSIHTKVPGRYLVGDDYVVYVNYWMGFNKEAGEGLHDIKRSKFGGEIYHKNGSHGCVNLPLKKAEELYQQVSVGDKVLVKK